MFPDDNAVVYFRDGKVIERAGDVSPEMEEMAQAALHRSQTIEATRAQIVAALRRLTEEGGGHNFVIIETDRSPCFYVQFATSCGSATVYGEAASGRYCTPSCPFKLNAAQRAQLLRLGWRPPTRRKYLNFSRHWPLITDGDRRAVAETAVETLKSVYGWRGDVPLQVQLHLDW